MADNTTKILLLVVILVVLGYAYQQQNSGVGIIGVSGEPAEKAAEKIVNRDCSGTEYIVQKPCSRNGVVLDGMTDETSGAGFETQVLDKNHEGFVRQLGDGVCPPKLVECNVDPPQPCSGNTWLDALCVRLDADGNEVVLEDGNPDACGDGIIKQRLDTSAADYKPATKGGSCTFEKSGACQKTCPEPQPPVCNYPVLGWQYNDLGCVKSQDDLTPAECGETGVIQRYKASTMNTEYCKNLTEWVSCTMKPCPQDCEGEWSDWTPNPDACDVQPSESRIYSITKPSVGNTQFGYGKPCEEIHDKVETRSRQDPIQPCCTQNHDWAPAFSAHGGTCKPDGTGIYAQTTIGNCPDDVKSAYKACCWESGDWRDVGECQMNGKQKQVQATTGNCIESIKTREIDCCWKNQWSNVGTCNSNGEQPQSRVVAGSCEAVTYPKDPVACAAAKQVNKEGVKGVRYVKFGYKDKINSTSRGNFSGDAYHGKAGQPFDNYLNIGGIEIYSGGVNVVKNWDREPELLKGVTVDSEFGHGDPTTGQYGTARLFDADNVTMWHSGDSATTDSYFQIDLGKEYTIDEVKVINRQDSNDPRDPWHQRWQGAVLELLDSSKSVLKTGEAITATDTANKSKTYRFAISPDTLAKLEDILDVVPEDLSTMSNNTWMQVEPACMHGDPVDEQSTSRTVPCHYVGSWEAWGSCNGQHKYRQRKVVNSHLIHPTHGTNTPAQERANCKNCKGEWRQEYESKHGRSHRRNRHKRADWQRFYKTQEESGGGHCSGLPAHGSYRKTDNYTPCGHTHNEDGQCGFRYASWKWMEANYNNNAVVETVYSSG
tara:strand:+ start:702 stop:3179 length:2478 start_codon:yes stop_codon:yes gene_type:complete